MMLVRRLNFDLLYRAKEFDNRRITSTVYHWNGEPDNINLQVQDEKAEKIRISDQIKEVALTASEMAPHFGGINLTEKCITLIL